MRGINPARRPGRFLDRHGAGSDDTGTAHIPYYLLIVGDPATIPFEFQYGLDSQPYAVGRIWFEKDGQPDLNAFARYARSVRTAEGDTFSLPRQAVVFGPQNPDVPILEISSRVLLEPLQRRLRTAVPEWELTAFQKEQATKSRLGRILGGLETPSLLVAVCNGTSFSAGHDLQLRRQGALYCQDWAGGSRRGTPEPSDYFSADDVPDDARPYWVWSPSCSPPIRRDRPCWKITSPPTQRRVSPDDRFGPLPRPLAAALLHTPAAGRSPWSATSNGSTVSQSPTGPRAMRSSDSIRGPTPSYGPSPA